MRLADSLPENKRKQIQWMGHYDNKNIVQQVFNQCDAIVVPSIWAENSPLVIHEAFQARVPVITANYGGMSELVAHGVNGLLFDHRDPVTLAIQMQRLIENPELAARLGARGYLKSGDGNVIAMSEHIASLEGIYEQAILSVKRRISSTGTWK